MAADLSVTQVLKLCDWLEGDFTAGRLLQVNQDLDEVYHLNDVPNVSREITRGRQITNPVPRLSEWVQSVTNQVITYQMFPVLTGLGDTLSPTAVDSLEALAALLLAEWNKGQGLRKRAYRQFLRRTHCVFQLIPGGRNDTMPFSATLPNLNTCFFERFEGGRPEVICRSYDMLMKDAVRRYSGKKGSHDGAGQQLSWNDDTKRLSWESMSEDYVQGTSPMTSFDGFATVVHVKEFHGPEGSWHVITTGNWDTQADQKLEVYKQENFLGGTPFYVVPSNPQGHANWYEDWRAIGWPGYTRISQINRLESIRATLAEQNQQHILMNLGPTAQDAVDKLRKEGFAPILHGGTNFIPLSAQEIIPWANMTNTDIQEAITEKKEELERWISSYLFPATEQTISQANVGTAQLGLQVVHQNEAGLINCFNDGIGGLMEMAMHGFANAYLGSRTFYAREAVTYGEKGAKSMDPGSSLNVTAEIMKKVVVYGPTANIQVQVVTRSETESELEQRETGVWNNVQRKSQTFDDYIAVRNPDVMGQYEKLAEDGIKKDLALVFDQALPIAAAARNRLMWGEDISTLLPGAQQAQPQDPGGVTTVTQAAPGTGSMDISNAGGVQPAGAATA